MEIEKNKTDILIEELKKRRGGEKIVDVEEEQVKIVVFSLLNDNYAFYGNDIKEILPLTKIFYVPGAPDYILGIINVRGDIESVININKFFGFPDSKNTRKSRIAMAEKDGIRSGILVESIEDVFDVPVSSIKPPLSTLDKAIKEFVTGEMIYKNKNVTFLDVGRIFAKF
ncbi:MAG: purine-binding chemotaxis protein CheW [Nitrospirae bacterium]|nr:purine-binding chemotaxis protein CheW [Nitrospirota bacterium]